MTGEELEHMATTEQQLQQRFQHRVHVCVAAGCLSSSSDRIKEALDTEAKRCGLDKTCLIKGVGCLGPCAAGPLVSIASEGIIYQHVSVEDVPDLLQSLGRTPVQRLQYPSETPFIQRQVKVVLENSGTVDPERLEDSIAAGGYTALLKALTSMTPQEVIAQIVRSGLRGRGGGWVPDRLEMDHSRQKHRWWTEVCDLQCGRR